MTSAARGESTAWAWGQAGVGMLMALIGVSGVLNGLMPGTGGSVGVAAALLLGVLAVAVLALWLYRRVIMGAIARRDAPELPARPGWRPLLLGAASGVAFMAVSAAIVAAAGGYRFGPGAGLDASAWFALAAIGGLILGA